MLEADHAHVAPAISAFAKQFLDRVTADWRVSAPAGRVIRMESLGISVFHATLGTKAANGVERIVDASLPEIEGVYERGGGDGGKRAAVKAGLSRIIWPSSGLFEFVGSLRLALAVELTKRGAAAPPDPVLVSVPSLFQNPSERIEMTKLVVGVLVGAAVTLGAYLAYQAAASKRRGEVPQVPPEPDTRAPSVRQGGALAVTWTQRAGIDIEELEHAASEGRFEPVADAFVRFHSFRYFDSLAEADAFWQLVAAATAPTGGRGTLRLVAILTDPEGALRGDGSGPGLREGDGIRALPSDARTRVRFGRCDADITADAGFYKRV